MKANKKVYMRPRLKKVGSLKEVTRVTIVPPGGS